jgi:hypothetical protein
VAVAELIGRLGDQIGFAQLRPLREIFRSN